MFYCFCNHHNFIDFPHLILVDGFTYIPNRIGYDKPVKPDDKTLHGLHYAHLLTIPFENRSK